MARLLGWVLTPALVWFMVVWFGRGNGYVANASMYEPHRLHQARVQLKKSRMALESVDKLQVHLESRRAMHEEQISRRRAMAAAGSMCEQCALVVFFL